MRTILWIDDDGYWHRSLIRNDDPDDKAPEIGILSDPPSLDLLNWEAMGKELPGLDIDSFKRELHNRLVRSGLASWSDVQRSQNGLTAAIMAVGRSREILAALKRPLIMLYKQWR